MGVEIYLNQYDHPDDEIQLAGVRPSDPYMEVCWGAVLRPRTIRLLHSVAELTHGHDYLLSDLSLWHHMGEATARPEVRSWLLGTALLEAHRKNLGVENRLSAPSEALSRRVFTVYRTVPLVPTQDLDRLHDVQLAHHVQTVREVNERLESVGYEPVDLPGWVYWQAGFEDRRAGLEDVRDALFARGLPSWPPTPGQKGAAEADAGARSPGVACVERLDALERRSPETPGASL